MLPSHLAVIRPWRSRCYVWAEQGPALIMWLKRLGSDERHNLASDLIVENVPLDRYYRSPTIRAARANARLNDPLVGLVYGPRAGLH